MDLTTQNMVANFGQNPSHLSVCADVFDFLRDNDDVYDVIILDPPAFAKHRGALNNALQAYKRLNAAAFRKLKPGGILFTFSCSQVVTRENFRNAVFSGSIIANRNVRIMHQLTQPADHPINIYHPEGEYLKGLVLYAE
jgi:23S rRNA (cytosine1962-C5)-methyltransferase